MINKYSFFGNLLELKVLFLIEPINKTGGLLGRAVSADVHNKRDALSLNVVL